MEASGGSIISWSDELSTGLDDVDIEHRELISLINRLSAQHAEGVDPAQLLAVLAELRAYSRHHFENESRLMQRWPVLASHRQAHLRAHACFVKFLDRAAAALDEDPRDATEQLLAFLVDWLLHHITGADRQMAQAVLAAAQGQLAGAAGSAEQVLRDNLVDKVSHLYDGIAARNFDLLELNRRLRREVDLRTRIESELRVSQARAASLYRYAPIALWEMDWQTVWADLARLRESGVTDLARYLADHPAQALALADQLRVVDVNEAALRLFAAPTRDDLLRDLRRCFQAAGTELFVDLLLALEDGAPDHEGETTIRRLDGERRHVAFNVYVAPQDHGARDRIMVAALDITERKQAHERLQHLALHDALTNLPNRTLFRDRLRQALVQGQRQGSAVALLNVDLDDFKPVNDEHGHAIGDLVLQQVAQRLLDAVRASDTVARMGGDEFYVLLPGAADAADALRLAGKICATLAEPFDAEGKVLHIGASVGVALYRDQAGDDKTLMRQADAAMYRAKQAGGHRAWLHGALVEE